MKIIYEDFNNSNIYNLHKLFLSGSEAEEVKNKYTKGGVGYGELKKLLVQSIISYIEPMRTKRESLEKNLNEILERNSNFFDDEVEKLDKWADDMKKSL
jgi:tryptophanyl-tRNA synthetase